jgi:3-oxoacyl-[acyl-carrier-protein] synthase-3
MHTFTFAINYLVHAFMYGYFALNDTVDDHNFRRLWGKKITFMQCTQFVIDLSVYAVAAYHKFVYGRGDNGSLSIIASFCFISSYLYLFLQFAEEKYGWYSQFCHFLWKRRQSNNNSQHAAIMPWERTDLTLNQKFEEAIKMAVMLSYFATPDDLMAMYGSYKVAKEGAMPAGFPEPEEDKVLMKYKSWKAHSSLTKEQAQLKYIETLTKLSEKAKEDEKKKASKTHVPLGLSNGSQVNDPFILYPVKIAGHGRYVPQRVVTTRDIELLGNFEQSTQEKKRTGVVERRWVDNDNGENLIENAARAVKAACLEAGINVQDIDLIVGGFGGHQFLPDDACLVQRELGLGESGVRSFTVHATCLSFLVAMDVAGALMHGGRYRNVAVFASNIASLGLNKKDPHTLGLLGDGAAAVILQPSGPGSASAVHRVHVETYGEGSEVCAVRSHGINRPHWHPLYQEKHAFFEMDGEATLAFISKYIRGVLNRGLSGLESGLTNLPKPGSDKETFDIDWVVPHQASAVGVDSMSMFGWPKEKVLRTLEKYGNTIAASIPLTLCEHIDNGNIKRGDKVLMCGTSAGLSFGAMLITY